MIGWLALGLGVASLVRSSKRKRSAPLEPPEDCSAEAACLAARAAEREAQDRREVAVALWVAEGQSIGLRAVRLQQAWAAACAMGRDLDARVELHNERARRIRSLILRLRWRLVRQLVGRGGPGRRALKEECRSLDATFAGLDRAVQSLHADFVTWRDARPTSAGFEPPAAGPARLRAS